MNLKLKEINEIISLCNQMIDIEQKMDTLNQITIAIVHIVKKSKFFVVRIIWKIRITHRMPF